LSRRHRRTLSLHSRELLLACLSPSSAVLCMTLLAEPVRPASTKVSCCVLYAGGTCAQRVAARLIPRFAHRFPQKLEQAAAALITITSSHSSTKDPDCVRALSKVSSSGRLIVCCRYRWHTRTAARGCCTFRESMVHFDTPYAHVHQAARPEALHGLAKICEAASGVASSAGGAVVTKATEVLLRCLMRPYDHPYTSCVTTSGVPSVLFSCEFTSRSNPMPCYLGRRMSSEINGKTSTPAGGSISEPACALQSLQSAFRTSTRVVLATSLQVGLTMYSTSFSQ
jgi:hypothetical protein